jgi:hypothetical protein
MPLFVLPPLQLPTPQSGVALAAAEVVVVATVLDVSEAVEVVMGVLVDMVEEVRVVMEAEVTDILYNNLR